MSFAEIAVVTGGTGFVGSRLVRALLARGAQVRIVSSGSATGDAKLKDDARLAWFGLSDADLDRASEGATHFFNFGVVYDRPSIDDATISAINVDLPMSIVARLKAQGLAATCILGDTFFRKFPPEATAQARYTRSKNELAKRLNGFANEQALRLALLQIEQVYGPGEAFTKALPAVTKQLVEGVPRIAMTSGVQGRDFVFVDDVVEAAMIAAHSEWDGVAVVECGRGVAIPVRDVFKQLHDIARSGSVLGFGDIAMTQGIDSSVADTSWLSSRGWNPRVSLREGLTRLVRDVEARVART
ncbi:MAG: NAD(P)-dependent oxidoreductase [Rhodocyclaceae bacterium]